MLKAVREYLSFAGVQYLNPDKAGDEREKMLTLRKKVKRLGSLLQNWLKPFKLVIQNGNCNRLVSG